MYWSVMNELSDSWPCTSLAAARSGPSSSAASSSAAATRSLIGDNRFLLEDSKCGRWAAPLHRGAMNPQSWTFNRSDYMRERAQQIRDAMNAHVRLNELYAQRKAGLQAVASSATSRPHTAASQPDRRRVRISPLLSHDAATCRSGRRAERWSCVGGGGMPTGIAITLRLTCCWLSNTNDDDCS
jgi:hypothetical protein